MLLGLKQSQIDDWSQSLHSYEKGKRTKRPFGRRYPQKESSMKPQVEAKSMLDPILQDFKEERDRQRTIEHEEIGRMNEKMKYLKNNYKYNEEYDIVNLHPTFALPQKYRSQSFSNDIRKKEYKDPTYNDFNLINGRQYQRGYLERRALKREKQYQRKIHHQHRNYNIISGGYGQGREDSRGSEVSSPQSVSQSQAISEFDPICCRYLNPQKEDNYQSEQLAISISHGKESQEKMPPSYKNRESLQLNPTAPVPLHVQQIDMKQKIKKSRYKKGHLIEEEYKLRNRYDNDKKEELTKNRVHNGRMLEFKGREFNILNACPYNSQRTELLFGKQPDNSGYDVRPYMRESSSIRQSGFSTIDR